MRSPEAKKRSNLADFDIIGVKFGQKRPVARKLEELERRGKKHSTTLLILNVHDVNRFEIRPAVWLPEVIQCHAVANFHE